MSKSNKTHIHSFIRFNQEGTVEKVSWFKTQDGNKEAIKTPFKPGAIELQQMAMSQYGEISI